MLFHTYDYYYDIIYDIEYDLNYDIIGQTFDIAVCNGQINGFARATDIPISFVI